MARERFDDGEQKKVRARIVDKEVNTLKHDALFWWLLSNITPVLHRMWDIAPADVSVVGVTALAKYRADIEAVLGKIRTLEVVHRANASIVEGLQFKAKQIAELSVPQLDASAFGVAGVVEWSAQHPVHKPSGTRETVQQQKLVGFVDARARIMVLDRLVLSAPSLPHDLEHDPYPAYISYLISNSTQEQDDQETMRN